MHRDKFEQVNPGATGGGGSQMKRISLFAALTIVLVLVLVAPAFAGVAPYSGVALYSGGNATLSGSCKVESTVIDGQPSAASYVNGSLFTSGSASLDTTVLLVGARGDEVPPLSQFMPDNVVSSLTLASQAAQKTGTTYNGLRLTGSRGRTFTKPITVMGDLLIAGSGTYSFDSVYVTGDVIISGSTTVSFVSLRVDGTLEVTGGTGRNCGPCYVAGDVILSGAGTWAATLLVTAGDFSVADRRTVGGDGTDNQPQPVQVLLVGKDGQASVEDTSKVYGLLYNSSGGLRQSGYSIIRGGVLLGGGYVAAGACSVQYDEDILEKLIHSGLSFTVSFDSNGGSDVEPVSVESEQTLGVVPVPNKAGSIFLGWYTDDNSFEHAVTKDTPVISDMTLYARYAEFGGGQEADQVSSSSAMDCEPDFAIQLVSSDASMSAEAVLAALQLDVVDDTPFSGLSVSGSGGTYTVTAVDGYRPGSSYKLTLTDAALSFAGEPESIRTYCFTIKKAAVDNLQLDSGVIQVPATDVTDMSINGAPAPSLSVPLATTEAGLSDLGTSGTFTYTGPEPLKVGDVLAIYEGTPPDERDPTVDYSDQRVAYVEVTAVDGQTVTYKAAEAEKVMFTPDVLPVKVSDDSDGDPGNSSITIAISKMTYTDPEFAELGLGPDTVVEEGDFLALGTGDTEEDAEVTFAKITSVVVSGDDYVITYVDVSEDELRVAMDLYSSHDADYAQVLEQADVPAIEAAIAQQAIDSGFAQAAAEYLVEVAQKTDGFQGQVDQKAMLAASGSGPTISNLQVTAQIDARPEHFNGLSGLDCAVTVSFDVGFGEDLNLHVSGTFEEEVRVTFNADGQAVWRTKKVWIFKIPYIADYRMTGNLDLYNYTGIDVKATLTTSAGDSSPIDIAKEIKDLMSATNYQAEQISAQTQEFYELYAEMLANEHDYVEIFNQRICHFETGIDPLHILVAGLTLEFSVSADVNLSIGAQFDYTKGTRYVFTLLLFSKQSTSDKVDLVDETYNLNFYVMGTLGLRAGVIARVELGLFTLSLDSIGLELEIGPYARLWGYFFYELHYANHVSSSKTSGALYFELGIYLETRFLAQVLNGQYSYNPTLYAHEWPLWTAGSRYNTYDFSYTLTDATDDIRLRGATKTYTLPAATFSMKQLDLTEGDVTTEPHPSSDFTISFTNNSFTQTNGTITVTPPAGQHIAEGYMTITWKGAPLSFTTVPISRTYHVVWDDLASSYMITFNSQGGSVVSNIVGAYGTPVTLPTPTRAGYTFGGWYTTAACTGTAYTTSTMPATNLTLYAKWTPNTTTSYTVRHYQQTVAGTSYVLVETQTLTGTTGTQVTPARKTYPGFTAPAAQTVTIAGTGTTAVEYRYTRNSYQLIFTPGAPDADIVRTVAFGGLIAPPAVARAGYTFGGWYDNVACSGTAYAGTTMPAAALHLYAKWTANTNTNYTVRHYQENLTAGTYTLAATQSLTGTTGTQVTPAVNAYPGFTAPAAQTVTIAGTGTTVVNYYYSRSSYQVTFHPNNGGLDTTATFRYGAFIVLPTVNRAGYTFAGWYDNGAFSGSPYTATSTMPAAPLQLYAKWTANAVTYTVEHWREITAGTLYSLYESETFSADAGSQATPAVKTYEGFTAPAAQTVTVKGDGSTVVRYDYQRNGYELLCHPNNGAGDITNTIRYGATLVLPPVSYPGFVFQGWFTNEECTGEPYIATAMPASNLELWASWRIGAVIMLPVEISSQLSSGEDATVAAPALVHDTVTFTWDTSGGELVPAGSIVVTGTMPDGHTWVVYNEPIPANATQPYVITTTDQVLGTGDSVVSVKLCKSGSRYDDVFFDEVFLGRLLQLP